MHLRWLLLLTALIFAPSLTMGFAMDDWWWLVAMDAPPEAAAVVGPYHMRLDDPAAAGFWRDHGVHPWWALTGFRWVLMRPAFTALLQAQWWAFGQHTALWHAVALLAYLGLVAAVSSLYRRVLGPSMALFATAVFALHLSHSQTVWFLCNVHSTFSAIAGVLALHAHIRWRQEGWGPGAAWSVLALGAGLLFGESTLAALAYIGLYELLDDEGTLAERLRALVPMGLLSVAYVAIYVTTGHGTALNGLYQDPSRETGGLLLGLADRWVASCAGTLGVMPADIWRLLPEYHVYITWFSLFVCLQAARILAASWSGLDPALRRALAWLSGGAVFSLLPGMAAPISGRLLLLGTVGGSALLGVLVHRAWRGLRAPVRPRGTWSTVPFALPTLLAPLYFPALLLRMSAALDELQASAEASELPPGDEAVFALTLPTTACLYLLPTRAALDLPTPPVFWQGTCTEHEHLLRRTGERQVELQVLDGQMFEASFERLHRPADHPLAVGEVLRQPGLTVTVLEAGPLGPTRLRFDLDQPLDTIRWLYWQDDRLRQLDLPALGDERRLPRPSTLLGAQ